MIKLAFSLSTINPLTGKHLREWTADGINGFISESYRLAGTDPQFMADHYNATTRESTFGLGKTPTEALRECLKQLN